ncbi:hypothetical protein TBC1_112035 [Lentimicrobium saccharophilum]|uniref:Uncharacterized protein n=2 Tax=Lentimicrobium saccharophilum TaxID=1678841 RepID=A0A0S7BSF9_9BACT|nr:hypothetical protein TBC1_112035 [Lentimicrobium saccharophilum]
MPVMNDKKRRIIRNAGMVLAAFAGSIFGLILTIPGYLLDWGPGSGMEGPLWKVMITGIASFAAGACAGAFLFRLLAGKLLSDLFSVLVNAFLSLAMMIASSTAAFITGWVVAYLTGKITGAISGLEWKAVLFYVPLMSCIYSLPVSLVSGVLFFVFVYIYLRKSNSGVL